MSEDSRRDGSETASLSDCQYFDMGHDSYCSSKMAEQEVCVSRLSRLQSTLR